MRKVVNLTEAVTAISYFPESRVICRVACNGAAAGIADRPVEEWDGELGKQCTEDMTVVVLLDKKDITAMYARFVLGEGA